MKQSDIENKSFFRIIAGYHNKLIGERDLLMGDLQNMAVTNTQSDLIISKIKELSQLEVQLDIIRKHFAQDTASDEQTTNKQSKPTD